ncbi:hypothetical protein Avbf_09287 [Armadillidium vulgare]|nr:hypothetical protein Avbf_09287 [Armadillidium vulgare]
MGVRENAPLWEEAPDRVDQDQVPVADNLRDRLRPRRQLRQRRQEFPVQRDDQIERHQDEPVLDPQEEQRVQPPEQRRRQSPEPERGRVEEPMLAGQAGGEDPRWFNQRDPDEELAELRDLLSRLGMRCRSPGRREERQRPPTVLQRPRNRAARKRLEYRKQQMLYSRDKAECLKYIVNRVNYVEKVYPPRAIRLEWEHYFEQNPNLGRVDDGVILNDGQDQEGLDRLDAPVSLEELTAAIKATKANTAKGLDGVKCVTSGMRWLGRQKRAVLDTTPFRVGEEELPTLHWGSVAKYLGVSMSPKGATKWAGARMREELRQLSMACLKPQQKIALNQEHTWFLKFLLRHAAPKTFSGRVALDRQSTEISSEKGVAPP